MPPLFNRSLQALLVGNIMNLYHRAITSTPAASAERGGGQNQNRNLDREFYRCNLTLYLLQARTVRQGWGGVQWIAMYPPSTSTSTWVGCNGLPRWMDYGSFSALGLNIHHHVRLKVHLQVIFRTQLANQPNPQLIVHFK